jgi:hypothetical protein
MSSPMVAASENAAAVSRAAGMAPAVPGWLVGPRFDAAFILGIAALALAAGFAVASQPQLFLLILFLDLWLLGYHHVISTYTRLCFDRESFAEHRFLVLYLPPIVFAATLALALGIGVWVLVTVYLYWQWFHYTRQSWGILQSYRRKDESLMREPRWFVTAAFYLVPLWGILQRSAEEPATFIGLPVRVLPVPGFLADAVGLAACLVLAFWVASRVMRWWRGQLVLGHTLYFASHIAVFAAGYLLIADITYGWLVINIWHNLQYIAFTWLYNNRRFRGGVSDKAKFLSRLSQKRNWAYYLLFCFAISTALYAGLSLLTNNILAVVIPAMVIFQAINFHHYIVDGLIWKVRRRPMREILGLSPALPAPRPGAA